MSDQSSVSYSASADFHWTERAYALLGTTLTVNLVDAGTVPCFVVEGDCPRCGHSLIDRQTTVALVGLSGSSRGQGADDVDAVTLDVTCNCGTAHQGAPQGATGCGVSFRLEVVTA